MSEELKPCPFCGAHNRGDILDIYPASPSLGQNKWRVVCDDCGAECPTVPAHNADNPDELCERAWNTRADDAELDRLRAENERLREEISAFDELTAWVGFNSNIDWDKVSADPIAALDGINRRVAEVIFRADRDLPACAALGEQP